MRPPSASNVKSGALIQSSSKKRAPLTTAQPQYPQPAQVSQGRAIAPKRAGGGLFFGASLLSQASALIRYVALARLLGPEQLGIAATLMITATFFDMVSDTGADRFLLQDRQGDEPAVQDIVQLVWVGRGLAIAAALFFGAPLIAGFYRIPHLAEAFAVLALSPLIQGFLHLDVRRAQRDHDFRPQAISMLAAEAASLAVTIAAAWITRDYTAILYGLITRAAVSVAASHLLARRPYRLAWRSEHAGRLGAFGLPLMFNGLLIFLALQGDRAVISGRMGPTALGYYTVIAQLISYPLAIVSNYLHVIFIPMVAAERDAPAERDRVSELLGGQLLVLNLAMAAGFALVAPAAVPILFGARFAQPALLITLVGLLQGVRFFLTWPTTVALAMGRSGMVAAANLAHTIALAAGLAGLALRGDLVGFASGMIVGEFVASAVALALLARATGRSVWALMTRLGVFAAWTALIVAWNLDWRLWSGATRLVALMAATTGLTLLLVRNERAAIDHGARWLRARIAEIKGPVHA
jgi:O-antigen/teichoic acid export membrane protein